MHKAGQEGHASCSAQSKAAEMALSKAWSRRGWAGSVFLFFWLERLTLNSEVLLSFLMTLKDPHGWKPMVAPQALQALINGLLLLLILRLRL